MKNDDDQCFKWAVTRALNPIGKNPDRITKELKDQAEKYDWSDLNLPVKVKDISIWESKNKNKNIKINVCSVTTKTPKRCIPLGCMTDVLA